MTTQTTKKVAGRAVSLGDFLITSYSGGGYVVRFEPLRDTGNVLSAVRDAILDTGEIKRIWPGFNYSVKR